MQRRGAYVMGRDMFGPIRGPRDEDRRGCWGDEPPYHAPVFVLRVAIRRTRPTSAVASDAEADVPCWSIAQRRKEQSQDQRTLWSYSPRSDSVHSLLKRPRCGWNNSSPACWVNSIFSVVGSMPRTSSQTTSMRSHSCSRTAG